MNLDIKCIQKGDYENLFDYYDKVVTRVFILLIYFCFYG